MKIHAAVIEDSAHWIMEEQPEQAVTLILSFPKRRMTLALVHQCVQSLRAGAWT